MIQLEEGIQICDFSHKWHDLRVQRSSDLMAINYFDCIWDDLGRNLERSQAFDGHPTTITILEFQSQILIGFKTYLDMDCTRFCLYLRGTIGGIKESCRESSSHSFLLFSFSLAMM